MIKSRIQKLVYMFGIDEKSTNFAAFLFDPDE
jgi:hypothetical protein